VSRALDRLRTQFGERGVQCTGIALGTLLEERSVEAAPSGLVIALAALRIPTAAGLGAGAAFGSILLHVSKAKLVAGLAGALLIGGVAIIWLYSQQRGDRVSLEAAKQQGSFNQTPATQASSSGINSGPSIAGATNQLDPAKLLQGVVRARQRIISGEMEFRACLLGRLRRLPTGRAGFARTSPAPC